MAIHFSKNLWALLLVILLINSCNKDNEPDFTADFSVEFADDNHVKFLNKSTGEYYAMQWDFGNGQTLETTDKSKNPEIYYPEAGDYQVTLVVQNYTGQVRTTSQKITILKDDLVLSFSTQVNPSDPNTINLVNTSTGVFDSFFWIFRNKKVENAMQYAAYFPFKGQYDITLEVTKNGVPFSLKKTVVIAADDPNYTSKLVLKWSDEFDGTSVNTGNWTFETGANGWGNNELQNYTNGNNASVNGGKLVITAIKVNDNKTTGSYTSSRMITLGKKEFTFGRMEIRAKLPSGTGIWPAIWMLGSSFPSAGWPACGEIDIMEYVGYQPNTVHATVHTPSGFGNAGNGTSVPLATCEEEFHAYGIVWTEQYIKFYIDDVKNVIHTYAPANKNEQNWPFDKPAFFILNVAVGGNWGGANGIDNSIFPQSLEVDYIRVYQEPGQ